MKDFFKKTLETFAERVNSPLLSSTVFSWLVFNYKFILVVISSADFKTKINYIEGELYKNSDRFELWVVYPVLVGLSYTVVYPYIDILFVAIQEFAVNVKERVVLWIRRKRPIDSDLAKNYFQKFDDQLEEKQRNIQGVLDSAERERKAAQLCIQDLRNRLRRQTLLSFANGGPLSPDIFEVAFKEPGDSNSDSEVIRQGLRSVRLKPEILEALDVLDALPEDKLGRYMVRKCDFLQYRANELAGDLLAVEQGDLVEILLVLQLIAEVSAEQGLYDATMGRERIGLVRGVLTRK